MHVHVHAADQTIIPGSPEGRGLELTLSLPFAIADGFFMNRSWLFNPSFVTTLGQCIKKSEYIV